MVLLLLYLELKIKTCYLKYNHQQHILSNILSFIHKSTLTHTQKHLHRHIHSVMATDSQCHGNRLFSTMTKHTMQPITLHPTTHVFSTMTKHTMQPITLHPTTHVFSTMTKHTTKHTMQPVTLHPTTHVFSTMTKQTMQPITLHPTTHVFSTMTKAHNATNNPTSHHTCVFNNDKSTQCNQ